jgi:hypothetical protein
MIRAAHRGRKSRPGLSAVGTFVRVRAGLIFSSHRGGTGVALTHVDGVDKPTALSLVLKSTCLLMNKNRSRNSLISPVLESHQIVNN